MEKKYGPMIHEITVWLAGNRDATYEARYRAICECLGRYEVEEAAIGHFAVMGFIYRDHILAEPDRLSKHQADAIGHIKGVADHIHKAVQSKAGKKAAEALHAGSRAKRAEIQSIWKSGKYSTKALCAEQEYEAIGMSYETARKALRGL